MDQDVPPFSGRILNLIHKIITTYYKSIQICWAKKLNKLSWPQLSISFCLASSLIELRLFLQWYAPWNQPDEAVPKSSQRVDPRYGEGFLLGSNLINHQDFRPQRRGANHQFFLYIPGCLWMFSIQCILYSNVMSPYNNKYFSELHFWPKQLLIESLLMLNSKKGSLTKRFQKKTCATIVLHLQQLGKIILIKCPN